MGRRIAVTTLLDVGAGDEVGTPNDEIAYCATHDTLYREGAACLDCEGEEGA